MGWLLHFLSLVRDPDDWFNSGNRKIREDLIPPHRCAPSLFLAPTRLARRGKEKARLPRGAIPIQENKENCLVRQESEQNNVRNPISQLAKTEDSTPVMPPPHTALRLCAFLRVSMRTRGKEKKGLFANFSNILAQVGWPLAGTTQAVAITRLSVKRTAPLHSSPLRSTGRMFAYYARSIQQTLSPSPTTIANVQ